MDPKDKECQNKSDEFLELMFRKFKKFLQNEKEISRIHKQSKEISSSISTCHQYE